MSTKSKEKGFTSKLGFIAAAASSAVGVGNIWRFPYLTGKYGGASFVLLYIICVLVLGCPLILAKLAFGRKMQAGTYNSYNAFKPKYWALIGLGSTIISFIILSYYVVITGWITGYFFNFFNGNILKTTDFAGYFSSFVSNVNLNIFYTFLIIISILYIVKKGITNGIERVSKFLMPIFVIMLILLIIYCSTLKGSVEGLKFYLLPRLDGFSIEAFHAALTQSFLSLSIGLGITITYGAYVEKKDDLVKSTIIITFSDTIISLLAGLVIFPLIFQAKLEPNQGPSLIFISLPIAFKSIGLIVGSIVGAIFFLLLVFAAITSAIALLEVVVKYMMERFKFSRSKSIYLIGITLFFLSIPSILSNGGSKFFTKFWSNNKTQFSFLDTLDLFLADIFAPIIAIFFSIFIFKKFKINNLINEINNGSKVNKWLEIYLKVTITFVCPFFVSIIIFLKILNTFWR